MLADRMTPVQGVRNLVRSIWRWRPTGRLPGLLLAWLVGWALFQGFLSTRAELILYDGSQRIVWHTHQTTVSAVLQEAGITLGDRDLVSPDLAEAVRSGDVIRLIRAQQATVLVDGRVMFLGTHAASVGELLRELDVQLAPQDWLTLNGVAASTESLLSHAELTPRSVSSRGQGRPASAAALNAAVELVIHRAVTFQVDDGGALQRIRTVQPTIGEALLAEGIVLYLGDEIRPPLDSPVQAGMEVAIRRSRPVEIAVDGERIRSRTQAATVAEALSQAGVTLAGLDYSLPSEETPLPAGQPIRIVRVQRTFEVEQAPIPFETVWVADAALDLDHQIVQQQGQEGIHRWRYQVTYENGQLLARNLEEEWVAREPTAKAIAYGTKITIRDLETPQGAFQYWRRIPMLATSYSAATCGKSPDDPLYGITRLGWQMRHGIVAVDPSVVRLGSQVYVPGYGLGDVGDTGGAIRGRHIDLGYDEDNLVFWYKWTDVYLLTPVPAPDQIHYVLPNWPQRP